MKSHIRNIIMFAILLCMFSCIFDYKTEAYDMEGYCNSIYHDIYKLRAEMESFDFMGQCAINDDSHFNYDFFKLGDSVWSVKEKDKTNKAKIEIKNDTKIYLNPDSSLTIYIDEYRFEDEYKIHIASIGLGLVGREFNDGVVRIEVYCNNNPCGWGEIQRLFAGGYVVTGAY